MLGILKTDEARRLASEAQLDLVEVDRKANPPVCKIMDFGRFNYKEVKKRVEARKRETRDDSDPGRS
jgi:translation initiation factor IF-3